MESREAKKILGGGGQGKKERLRLIRAHAKWVTSILRGSCVSLDPHVQAA